MSRPFRRCLKTAKTAELRQRLFIHGTRNADNFKKGQKRAPEAEDVKIVPWLGAFFVFNLRISGVTSSCG